jgi:hypothetical protein
MKGSDFDLVLVAGSAMLADDNFHSFDYQGLQTLSMVSLEVGHRLITTSLFFLKKSEIQ